MKQSESQITTDYTDFTDVSGMQHIFCKTILQIVSGSVCHTETICKIVLQLRKVKS